MTLDPTTARSLTRRLAVEQATQRLPSVVGGIVRAGQLVWTGAAGTLDGSATGAAPSADTQYRMGSISKTFIAVEVMRLRDEGLVDLAATIGTYLPEVSFGHVTIVQLLTHTSGLQAETDGPWWERAPGTEWDALLSSGIALRLTPGTAFHYSNVGYAVLGELVSRIRGITWFDAVRDGILAPLGMTRTTTRPAAPAAPGLAVHPHADLLHAEPEHDAVSMAPAGQLWSTVHDLARWAAFLAGDTDDVLAGDSLREMQRPVAVNDLPGAAWSGAHGLGWQLWNIEGRRYAGHGGSMPGFLANLRVDLDTGDGVVVMTNATSGLGPVASDLLDAVRTQDPVSPTPWHHDPAQDELTDLVGTWFWGTYPSALTLEADGGFRLGEPGQGRGARFRRDGDRWVGLDGYYRAEPLVVERDDSGTPSRLVLASFVFTKTPCGDGNETPGWH